MCAQVAPAGRVRTGKGVGGKGVRGWWEEGKERLPPVPLPFVPAERTPDAAPCSAHFCRHPPLSTDHEASVWTVSKARPGGAAGPSRFAAAATRALFGLFLETPRQSLARETSANLLSLSTALAPASSS